jgi:hypothetical protein
MRILKKRCAKLASHIGSVVVLWERLDDLRIITEGGGLAIHFHGEANYFVCFTGIVEESGAEKCSEKALCLQRMTCLEITGGMRLTPTSALEVILMLPPINLFIKQGARQGYRLLGNGCSYLPIFGHSKVLIKMTDEMPLLLAPRDKFVTLICYIR